MRGDGTWVATGLLGLALVLGTQTPAAAWQQQPALSLSLDDENWTPALERPLFDADRRWVPGDVQTVTMWVQNLSTRPAELDLGLVDDVERWSGHDLARSLKIDGRPTRPDGGSTHRIDPAQGPTRIDLTLTIPQHAGNRTQHQTTGLRLQARLTQVDASGSEAAPADHAPPPGLSEPVAGHVPGSSTPPFGVPLMFVAVAVAVRAALLGLRRRHTQGVKP